MSLRDLLLRSIIVTVLVILILNIVLILFGNREVYNVIKENRFYVLLILLTFSFILVLIVLRLFHRHFLKVMILVTVIALMVGLYLFWPRWEWDIIIMDNGNDDHPPPDQPGIGEIWIQVPRPPETSFKLERVPKAISTKEFRLSELVPVKVTINEGKVRSVLVGDNKRLTNKDYFKRVAAIIKDWTYTDVKNGELCIEIDFGAGFVYYDVSELILDPKYEKYHIKPHGSVVAVEGFESVKPKILDFCK